MTNYLINYEGQEIEVIGYYEEAQSNDSLTQPSPASFQAYHIIYTHIDVLPIIEAGQLAIIEETVLNQIES